MQKTVGESGWIVPPLVGVLQKQISVPSVGVSRRRELTHRRGVTILKAVAASDKKLSKVEYLKVDSNQLRFPLSEELANDEIFITENAVQIMKFHGSYQQDNREERKSGAKSYQFMLRLKMPAGEMPASMYRVLDDLSDEYGNQTLRATTRSAWQLHGVLKGNLKTVFSTIMNNGGGTLGACGDLNRNIVATPAPKVSAPYAYARYYSRYLAELFAPQTGAFGEIWLDGEQAATMEYWKRDLDMEEIKRKMREDNGTGVSFPDKEEPIYGERYLPRKFKMGITVPGDNSIDIYTQDIGIVVICDGKENLEGFNVMVGGGMGRTHRKESTFPRIGDHLGYVTKDKLPDLIKAIVATQRDHGNREVRMNARMKYLVQKVGIEQFRKLVEGYFGEQIEEFRPLPEWSYMDWLGWHEQGDGKMFLGLFIENGRIKDAGEMRLKTALRKIVDSFNFDFVVSPNQNVILTGIDPSKVTAVETLLAEHGVVLPGKISRNRVVAMACPAFPLCGLAVTEAERHMPSVVTRVEALLEKMNLNLDVTMRMTGCPNGCARPYMAEIGFVGSAPMAYQLWLGGAPNQTRLAFPFIEKMNDSDMESTLEPLFVFYKESHRSGESFGDFCHRMGTAELKEAIENYSSAEPGRVPKPRISLNPSTMEELKLMAERRGMTAGKLADEILSLYLRDNSS